MFDDIHINSQRCIVGESMLTFARPSTMRAHAPHRALRRHTIRYDDTARLCSQPARYSTASGGEDNSVTVGSGGSRSVLSTSSSISVVLL